MLGTWGADGRSVTVHWDEIPQYVIWCRTHKASGWVRPYGGLWLTPYAKEAMIFLSAENAREYARRLSRGRTGRGFHVRVRPGRKKV
jgi:hypothetical protein